jgi:hypothetical protein
MKMIVDEELKRQLATHQLTDQEFWIRMHTKNSISYICADTKGRGRYYRDLPNGINPNFIIPITIDETNRPSIFLLDEFLNLLKGFEEGITIKIIGEPNNIDFVSSPGDTEKIQQLEKMLTLTKTACDEDYNQRVTASMMQRLRNSLFATIAARPTASTLIDMVAFVTQEAYIMRDANAADAQLFSWFMVYEALCRELEQYLRKHGKEEYQIVVLLTRYIAFGCAGGECNPDALLPALAEKMSHEGFHEIVEHLAESYLKRGEGSIEKALNSQVLNDFNASLYAAGLDLFAARRLYDALHVRPIEGLPKERIRLYTKSADIAEEKCVRVNNALFIGLQNRTGAKLEEHLHRVQKAHDEGGESSADDVVFELIEMSYFYPRFFEPILKGES